MVKGGIQRQRTTYEIKSWDEVFGRPLKKGKQLATERRNYNIGARLMYRVRERHRAGEKIDKGLFEAVGKEFDISGTTASELYYGPNREAIAAVKEARARRSNVSGKI